MSYLFALYTDEFYQDKRKIDHLNTYIFYASILLDIAFLFLACFSIGMAKNAVLPPCTGYYSRSLVYSVSAVCFLRCVHLVFIFLFMFCCVPCYMCQDECCLKRWLVQGTAAP